ncbi:MAG: NFYB/HAP3 family transcription factor subunit [Candidatus Aenigmarchaeota archaeon]|nr:NFYB/HAP3 family transcription factor subunit [Candidatus Aenigmarchaeota archaeon]
MSQELQDAVEQPVAEEEKEDAELEQKERLAFPVAAVVRVMRKNLDREKIIKKDVKIAMNKWLEKVCSKVAKEMNKIPYVTMSLNEFKEGIRVYEDMEGFDKDKQRILAHLAAIKADIARLERDLGKIEEAF